MQSPIHRQGEPSHRSLGMHLAMFTVLAIALAFMITLRPIDMRFLQLAAVLGLLGALVTSAWFLTRRRFDAIIDAGAADS